MTKLNLPDGELVLRAVRTATNPFGHEATLVQVVAEIFGIDEAEARPLCDRAGLGPDMILDPEESDLRSRDQIVERLEMYWRRFEHVMDQEPLMPVVLMQVEGEAVFRELRWMLGEKPRDVERVTRAKRS